MHVDAVQAVGRLAIDFAALDVDTLSISAHKFGGPKGIGALIVRDHVDLVPLIRGGGQERRRRAGTENVPAIAGFGAAAEVARNELGQAGTIGVLRDRLEAAIKQCSPNAVIVGEGAPRLQNTTAVALPGKLAETLVIRLDLAGIAVSAGSACSSGKVGASHVLEAMGFGPDIAASTIRVSLGPTTTEDDIAAFLAAWKAIVGEPALAA
jgi:cysteine desulfurase